LILDDDSGLRLFKTDLHSFDDIVQKVDAVLIQILLLDDSWVKINLLTNSIGFDLLFLSVLNVANNLDVIRISKHLGEQLVLVDRNKEDELANISLQTWWDAIHEVFHFILLSLVFINWHEILTNIVLDLFWDIKTMHCGVRIIQRFLELDIFFVHFLNKDSHFTKNVSVGNGWKYHHQYDEESFNLTSWCYFV
jgi:hypothetical protein